jgi:hypothetical protein
LLTVVEVSAVAVNCVFNPVAPHRGDTLGYPLPYFATPKTAWLQSRLRLPGLPTRPVPARPATTTVSLTEASGSADCLTGLVLNFGGRQAHLRQQPAGRRVRHHTGGLGTSASRPRKNSAT